MSRRKAMLPPAGAVVRADIVHAGEAVERRRDTLATEEPLEIRLVVGDGARTAHAVAVTMRTPGHDFELAAGFLLGEGIIEGPDDVWRLARCADPAAETRENIVEAHLAPGVAFDVERMSRHVYTTSSCGVCGKASIERLMAVGLEAPTSALRIARQTLVDLPRRLAAHQTVFARTGGLHAAGLFDAGGELQLLREDVGRHNALDKLIGASLLARALPLADAVIMVSGRIGFELVQKALVAGAPALVAVGAPSSLAVQTARELDLTLVGFLRDHRFNVYSGEHRIVGLDGP